MGQYSIKEVETLSGVKAHTLRVWEQRYDFLKPLRTDTNIRFYNDEQLRLILNISTLNRHGLRISKIAEMSDKELKDAVVQLTEQSHEPGTLLDSLIHSMIDFSEARFEKTLSTAIMSLGFENTFSQLIFPFMIRTGVLWSTGVVRPAQEHFISNLIRRKISVAIDNQFVTRTENTRKFVLFLPEGETHELLLLYSEYILRKYNHEVAYIGCSLPFDDIDFINLAFKPDYLLSFITLPPAEMPLQAYINRLSDSFPKLRIAVGGAQIQLQGVRLPANIYPIYSPQDLIDFLA
jgi:DNA-binding transcriptional MerR regulator